jgi:Tol biopolymer transport system component
MIADDADLERRLAGWLAAEAVEGPPSDLLEAILIETATTPRRATWRAWQVGLPRALRLGPTASFIARGSLAVAAALALIATILALSGGGQPAPPPTGPARTGLIAFDDAGDIFVEEPNGTGRRPLTSGPALETSPSFSPDGTRIAYWVRQAMGVPSSLWVMNADGSGAHNVSGTMDLSGGENVLAAWSPDSRQLAFSVGDYYTSQRLYVADAAGRGSHEVGGGSLARSDPAWSPDSRLIAFRGHTIGVSPDALPVDEAIGVYVIAPDGSGERLVSHAPRAGGAPNYDGFRGPRTGAPPSWSPDGRWLAYAYGPKAKHDIAIGAVDGSEERPIVTSGDDDLLPVYSPDGTRIAFERLDATGRASVRTVTVDGHDPRAIGGDAVVDFEPLCWSPDGSSLLTYANNGQQVRLLASDGTPVPLRVIDIPDVVFANGTNGSAILERASWQRLAP